jgi:hypothetical protein
VIKIHSSPSPLAFISILSPFLVLNFNVEFVDMSGNYNDSRRIVTMKSRPEEKIQLMSSMFYGRRDIFARLQENGYFILRFLADDIMNNLGEVMTRVVRRL